MYNKFIIETDEIEGDCLIASRCTYHKQLVTDPSKVKGGGLWTIDEDNSTMTFYGESCDFGRAKFEDILKCVQDKKVFTNPALVRNLSNDFKFQYTNECGETISIPSKINCPCCNGEGFVEDHEPYFGGISVICLACDGKGFVEGEHVEDFESCLTCNGRGSF